MHPDWVRSIRDQCQAEGVPFFFKQWGAWRPADQGSPVSVSAKIAAIHPDGNVLTGKDVIPSGQGVAIVHKAKDAGRMLDGREWSEFPKVGEVT